MEGQELKWWHVRWRLAGRAISRILIVSAWIVGPLCLLCAILYGTIYLIEPWLVSQRLGKGDPRLSIVPADLSTRALAPLSNASIDRYGFTFPLPNGGTVQAIPSDWMTEMRIRNGGWITIQNPSRNPGMLEIVSRDQTAKRLIGREELQSKFKLMQAAMWTTPEQAKWWRFRTLENQRVEYLLLTKLSLLTASASLYAFKPSPVYAIAGGDLRGFQIGNPDVAPYEAQLDLFDPADRNLELDIQGPEGHGQLITQAEINAIVASIRPAPAR